MKILFVIETFIALSNGAIFEDRVVGGKEAAPGQFPHQISIREGRKHYCGGSILNKRWILTAAHCTASLSLNDLQVVAGINDLRDENGQSVKVVKIVQHEDYTHDLLRNDISLLKIDRDLLFNSKVQPIKLNTQHLGARVNMIVSGWGTTSWPGEGPNKLQFINLKSITNEECNRMLRITDLNVIGSEVCTYTKAGEGACKGDSGGPLIAGDRLAGVVSWAIPCAKGFPDVFTRVSEFIGWINENMKN